MSCVFCDIVAGRVPSKKVYDDEHVYAFHDIAPVAPKHILIIPKAHVSRIDEPDAEKYATHIFKAIRDIAEQEGLTESGFRVVTNAGHNGGQLVHHLHFHLIGGSPLGGFSAS
jgi:histidine triad (HIT) family protein